MKEKLRCSIKQARTLQFNRNEKEPCKLFSLLYEITAYHTQILATMASLYCFISFFKPKLLSEKIYYTSKLTSMKISLTLLCGFKLKVFNSKCVSLRTTRLCNTTAAIRFNEPLYHLYQDLSQSRLEKISKTFSSKSNPSRWSAVL